MTDFPVPGPPATMKATFCWFSPAPRTESMIAFVSDLLFVGEREDRLVADHPRDVVEQAFVRAEGGVGDAFEDGSVVRPHHTRFEEFDQGGPLVPREHRVRRHE